MFKDIDLTNYDLKWELQRSVFLIDCLYEEISFKLKDEEVLIYQKNEKNEKNEIIEEEISIEELIYYIHFVVPECYQFPSQVKRTPLNAVYADFAIYFGTIDQIHNAVENMKIILKYDKAYGVLTQRWGRKKRK